MNQEILALRFLEVAIGEIGTKELSGVKHEEKILKYHNTTMLAASDDETSWCSSFVNWCVEEAGFIGTKKANAKSWLNFGYRKNVVDAKPGDIVVLWRESPDSWKGHVGFFAGRDGDQVYLLGGNQGDKVTYKKFPLYRVLGVRSVRE